LKALPQFNLAVERSRLIVQGFGNVGYYLCRLWSEAGGRVLAVSTSRGGVYNDGGLDVDAAHHHYRRTGSLLDFPGGEPISNAELLGLECEVLCPAALEGAITGTNAAGIRARIVVEAANGPTTAEADALLQEKDILVIPDILANAGGVTVSYFEWVQGLMNFFWKEADVHARLQEVMDSAFCDVQEQSRKLKVSMRAGAMALAVARVADAFKMRGLWP
jgi:glutamate dehydrogenase (NAD(P)+)